MVKIAMSGAMVNQFSCSGRLPSPPKIFIVQVEMEAEFAEFFFVKSFVQDLS